MDQISADPLDADQAGADALDVDQISVDQISADALDVDQINVDQISADPLDADQAGADALDLHQLGADVVTGPGTVTVAVRVKPGSSRARVGGRFDGPYGPALVIAVHPPAADGRATEAARRALAEALLLRPAAVSLRTGAASRDKLFQVDGPGPVIDTRLRQLRDGSAE